MLRTVPAGTNGRRQQGLPSFQSSANSLLQDRPDGGDAALDLQLLAQGRLQERSRRGRRPARRDQGRRLLQAAEGAASAIDWAEVCAVDSLPPSRPIVELQQFFGEPHSLFLGGRGSSNELRVLLCRGGLPHVGPRRELLLRLKAFAPPQRSMQDTVMEASPADGAYVVLVFVFALDNEEESITSATRGVFVDPISDNVEGFVDFCGGGGVLSNISTSSSFFALHVI